LSADLGVLGGGLMGLTLAHLQAARGHRVTVYEAGPAVGGLLRGTTLGGVACDRFYHCVVPTDADLLWLLEDLGVSALVSWRRTRTGFLHRGRLHSLDGIVDFLRFPPLRLDQRLRLGWTIFRTSRLSGWEAVDRIGVEEYLVRLGGRAVFETVWRPLLRAKLGEAYRETSAAFIWSTINRLYRARATPDRAEKLGFLRGSYEAVLARLLERLRERGVEVRTGVAVGRLEPETGGIRLHWAGGARRHDAVLATVPPAALAPLVAPLAPAYAEELERFRFHGVIAWVLVIDRPLTDYYVINLTDLDTPITGIIEMGNLAPPGTFGPGRSLVYLPRYTATDSPAYQGSDEAFRRECLQFVRRAVPAFSLEWIVDQAVFRAPSVLPIPTLGFGRAVPPFRSPIAGLYFAHNLHTYPRPLHNDAIVEVARGFDRVLTGERLGGACALPVLTP